VHHAIGSGEVRTVVLLSCTYTMAQQNLLHPHLPISVIAGLFCFALIKLSVNSHMSVVNTVLDDAAISTELLKNHKRLMENHSCNKYDA
jgi:hypothetical protein